MDLLRAPHDGVVEDLIGNGNIRLSLHPEEQRSVVVLGWQERTSQGEYRFVTWVMLRCQVLDQVSLTLILCNWYSL